MTQGKFEYDDNARFRIWVDGLHSEWTPYVGIARLNIKNGKRYIGTSPYHTGDLPTERVIEITEVETELILRADT